MTYKYGEPDNYGDFPYLYSGSYKEDQLVEILTERLPDHFDMQIVDEIESEVLTVLVNMGIDGHLEACTMGKEAKIENRMIGDKVVQQHLALEFDKSGMICLIRRLQEFNANDHFDFSECDVPEGEFAESVEESEVWNAARNLGSTILEVLGVEGQFNY